MKKHQQEKEKIKNQTEKIVIGERYTKEKLN